MKIRISNIFLLSALAVCVFFGAGCAPKGNEGWIGPPPRLIVALYDGSDKTFEKRNDIKSYLEADLVRMGFQVAYHDVDKGLPSSGLMKRSRAVITWFKDPEMRGAKRYCRWLARQVRSGKKLIVIDNFGAYQDKKNGQWIEGSSVNEVFNQIGVDYRANWTSDPAVLQVIHADKSIVGSVGPVNLADIAHYYHFKKIDSSVKEYLTVRRTDVPDSDSAVIFSHANGGMALTRYFTAFSPASGKEVPNIHFRRFLKDCLYGAERLGSDKVLIIGQPHGESLRMVKNVAQTLDYAKTGYDRVSIENFAEFTGADLIPYGSLVLCTGDLRKVTSWTASVLRRYVYGGGGLLVARGAAHPKLNPLFGIRRKKPNMELQAKGLRLADAFFPSASSIYYEEDAISTGALALELQPKTRVMARSLTGDSGGGPGIPLAWQHAYGHGRVLYWNANFLYLKVLRGILLHSVLQTWPVAVFSFANVESIHVDDSPQPSYNLFREPIGSTLNLTDTEFYNGPWWEGVLEISRKYGLALTFYTVFNYDGRTSLPFNNKEFLIGRDNAFLRLIQQLVDHNFELGFHGYNHEPLVTRRGGTGWKEKAMRKALQSARRFWLAYFPDKEEPFSYVAPMNLIDREGKKALKETLPSIRVISALYEEEGGEVSGQEFGPDPDIEGLFDFPRVTAGYFLTSTVRNELLNAVNSHGIWTHFIHPDDIFVAKRYTRDERKTLKTRDWATMRDSLDSLFAFVRQNFPWLRDFSTKDAYKELEYYLRDRRIVEFQENGLRIRFASGTQRSKFFGVRVNDGSEIGVLTNCRLLHADKLSGVFLFESRSSWAEIELKRAAL